MTSRDRKGADSSGHDTGRSRGRHPAALNFGDCMSYEIAAVAGMPLLFIGEDFSKTDIVRA